MHPAACTPPTRSPVVSPINRVVFLSIWPSGVTTRVLKILVDTFEYRVVPPLSLFEEKTPLWCVKAPYVVCSSHTIQSRRLNGPSFLLTSSGLRPPDISPKRMIDEVAVWNGRKVVMEWLGAIAIHENPARATHAHHWHVYIRFTTRLDINDLLWFCFEWSHGI
jgi:hypothetical protein